MKKTCTKCKEEKDFSGFYKMTDSKDGIRAMCKVCVAEGEKAWRERNPEQAMLLRVKYRAYSKGLAFNLEIQDIKIPEFCPALGIELNQATSGKQGGSDASPSLDRIIPELGYVKGNIRVVSNLANMIMSSASPEQIIKVARYVKQNG